MVYVLKLILEKKVAGVNSQEVLQGTLDQREQIERGASRAGFVVVGLEVRREDTE